MPQKETCNIQVALLIPGYSGWQLLNYFFFRLAVISDMDEIWYKPSISAFSESKNSAAHNKQPVDIITISIFKWGNCNDLPVTR